MIKFSLSALAVIGLLLSGCGSDSSSSSDTTDALASEATDITVERGPVLKATVVDANGKRGLSAGRGIYHFASSPKHPVKSYGGYIDLNRNGSIDAGDINMNGMTLQTKEGSVMTIVSTFFAFQLSPVNNMVVQLNAIPACFICIFQRKSGISIQFFIAVIHKIGCIFTIVLVHGLVPPLPQWLS